MEEKLHRRWVKIGGKKGSIFDGNFQLTPKNKLLNFIYYIRHYLASKKGDIIKIVPEYSYKH